jgi:hypothetical protein
VPDDKQEQSKARHGHDIFLAERRSEYVRDNFHRERIRAGSAHRPRPAAMEKI